ncbi:hypothetical protein ZOSMA_215G00020 [Zostera marina]|uniref:Uncharacterized protein n=1 Tax=Zostera marina TaxID=29655 RepID=A0A0K9PJY5_ZOSMR|nr:hypothetical protein ZOSMA_215G00020 [Zostera marina]
MAVQYLLPLRFLHSNHNHLLFGVPSRNPQRSSTFTSKSSPSLSLSSEREESRWVREEKRWIREEQRWIREEKRWNSERVSLLRQIEFLTAQLERPRQHRNSDKEDDGVYDEQNSPLEAEEDVKEVVFEARMKEVKDEESMSLKMESEGDDIKKQQDDYEQKLKHSTLKLEENAKEMEAKEWRSLRVGSEGDDVRELQVEFIFKRTLKSTLRGSEIRVKMDLKSFMDSYIS